METGALQRKAVPYICEEDAVKEFLKSLGRATTYDRNVARLLLSAALHFVLISIVSSMTSVGKPAFDGSVGVAVMVKERAPSVAAVKTYPR